MLVGACLALHVAADALVAIMPVEDVASLRLDEPSSIGNWLASTFLVIAGAAAAFVYSLRRHRIDDYHGRYRVWLWLLAVCLAASLAETTNLDRLARRICQLAANGSSLRNEVLWPTTVALIALAMGVRLFFEIRHCRSAVATLAGATLCFVFGAACNHGWPIAATDAGKPLLAYGGWLIGHVLLLATFLFYARHVQLEVTGVLAVRTRPKRSKAKRLATDESTAESSDLPAKPALRLRTDLDPVGASREDESSRSMPASSASKFASGAVSSEPPLKQHLSRAERRRMRRESRMAS